MTKSKTKKPTDVHTSAMPFRRIKKDHARETAEDYVEAIHAIEHELGTCRARDLAREFGVSHVTVHRIVLRLQREGLIDTEPYRPITLTKKGLRLANQSRKRHQIVYQFLLSLGVKEEIAAIDAEGIEHHVSQQTLDRFEAVMANGTFTSSSDS